MEEKKLWSEEDWFKEQEKQPKAPIFNIPFIIVILIGIMFVIHVARGFLSFESDRWFIMYGAFIPIRFTISSIDLIPGGRLAQYYSWISYSFLHGDYEHILFNSLGLVIFGWAVARRISQTSFLLLCTLGSIAGALAFYVSHIGDVVPMIGASAVVSGLMGAAIRFMFAPFTVPPERSLNASFDKEALKEAPDYLDEVPEEWISHTRLLSLKETFTNKNAVLFMVIWLGLNYAIGVGWVSFSEAENEIAWEAHIGGFLAGLLCYGFFEKVKK